MWKTLLGIRAGTLSYETDRPHDGLPIDEIIRRTWQEKEIVPAVATPRLGGSLVYTFHTDRHRGQVENLSK